MTTTTLDNKVKQLVSNILNLHTPQIVFNKIKKFMKCRYSGAYKWR